METKYCTGCKETKSSSEFNFKFRADNIRHSRCKKCMNANSKAHYKDNSEDYKARARVFAKKNLEENSTRINDYLKIHPCVDCGETCPVVLQFDHVRGKKLRSICDMLRHYYSWTKIETEIKKCEIRCANCHMKRTAKAQGWRYKKE